MTESAWAEVGEITVKPTDSVVEVGSFELSEGADTIWVRMTNTGTPEGWPWSYGILSFKTEEGQPLGSIKAYNSFSGEVFRLGVGLAPSVRTGVLTFEPRGFNLAWVKKGNPWPLKFEAQSGGAAVSTNPFWGRIGTTLGPANEGDDVQIGAVRLNSAGSGTFDDGRLGFGTRGTRTSILEDGTTLVMKLATSGAGLQLRQLTNGGATEREVVTLNMDGSGVFTGRLTASNVTLRSSASQYFSNGQYIGPELDLLQEIARLEQLVSHLYEKLRLSPPFGWEVWDGSTEEGQRAPDLSGLIPPQ